MMGLFQVLNDAFTQGDVRLINHKKYYFMVISYGYNNFKTYDPSDPSALDGQQLPYMQVENGKWRGDYVARGYHI